MSSAAQGRGSVLFVEHGTHKEIYPGYPWGTGKIRVSDQRIIDALREAFEKVGVEVEDAVA